jgi:hypothetical protein
MRFSVNSEITHTRLHADLFDLSVRYTAANTPSASEHRLFDIHLSESLLGEYRAMSTIMHSSAALVIGLDRCSGNLTGTRFLEGTREMDGDAVPNSSTYSHCIH